MRRRMNLITPLIHNHLMYSFETLNMFLLSHEKKDHMGGTKRIHEWRVQAISDFSHHSTNKPISRLMREMLVHDERMPLIVCRF